MMFIYVIAVYVSSDPGTYIVRIRFAYQNRVWQRTSDYAFCDSKIRSPLHQSVEVYQEEWKAN